MTTITQPAPAIRYSWHDLFGPRNHHDALLYDEDLANPAYLPPEVTEWVCDDDGGVLLWNSTADDNHGHFFMLTGQTSEQEANVMHNAAWRLSSGVCRRAAVRSSEGIAATPAVQYTDADGAEWWAWILPNDYRMGER